MLNYSKVPDYSLRKDILNLYLPVLPETKSLIQTIWDKRKPSWLYYDTSTKDSPLVATEWNLDNGEVQLKKLSKREDWQKVFK